MKERKTTEELWKEVIGQRTNCSHHIEYEDLETFRRLAVENERECAEAVGVTASLPGTNNGYTFVAFNGSDVPVGTKLFTFPPAAIDRDSVIEALQLAHDHIRLYLLHYTEKHNVFDTVTRALKSQPAAPDPRDEVIQQQSESLRMAREKFEHIREYWNGGVYETAMLDALNHIDDVAEEALAAIDKVPEGWKDVAVELPKDGQLIIGCNKDYGTWAEVWDSEESIGTTRWWIAAPEVKP